MFDVGLPAVARPPELMVAAFVLLDDQATDEVMF
jgi:hypothetical protein